MITGGHKTRPYNFGGRFTTAVQQTVRTVGGRFATAVQKPVRTVGAGLVPARKNRQKAKAAALLRSAAAFFMSYRTTG